MRIFYSELRERARQVSCRRAFQSQRLMNKKAHSLFTTNWASANANPKDYAKVCRERWSIRYYGLKQYRALITSTLS